MQGVASVRSCQFVTPNDLKCTLKTLILLPKLLPKLVPLPSGETYGCIDMTATFAFCFLLQACVIAYFLYRIERQQRVKPYLRDMRGFYSVHIHSPSDGGRVEFYVTNPGDIWPILLIRNSPFSATIRCANGTELDEEKLRACAGKPWHDKTTRDRWATTPLFGEITHPVPRFITVYRCKR